MILSKINYLSHSKCFTLDFSITSYHTFHYKTRGRKVSHLQYPFQSMWARTFLMSQNQLYIMHAKEEKKKKKPLKIMEDEFFLN